MQRCLMEWLESGWKEPDEGLWEVRGPRRHFTHSKILAWVAADRAVRTVEQMGMDGPVGRYRALREEIHADVCAKGYDADRQTFTQSYGSRALDAALLLIPQVGFLPPSDDRVRGTLRAVQAELGSDGLVRRYDTGDTADGVAGDEGAFLACSFWLADALVLDGRARRVGPGSRVCSACATTWACSRRSTTWRPGASSATCRRPTATSRWSTPPSTWPRCPRPPTGHPPRSAPRAPDRRGQVT